MPRSSRHKSHRQHKPSSKDVREQSDSEEDVNLKERNGKEKALTNVPRDSSSGEKRKLVSQSQDISNKHLFGPVNGDLVGEYSTSKRRREKVDGPVTDRWSSGEVLDKEKVEVTEPDTEKVLKSKASVDLKSKSSRKYESFGERKSESLGLGLENEELKKSSSSSSKVEQKSKSEKDLSAKEIHYKDSKEKEHRSERDKKNQDVRRETKTEIISGTANVSKEVENAVRQKHDELRNPELEKELEKRIRRRRDDSDVKDKYQDDSRDAKESRMSSRDDRSRNGRYKDEKHKDDKYRDRHHENLRKDHKSRDDKHRDGHLKDHTGHRSETKHSRNEKQSPREKSKPHDREGDGGPRIDDRVTYYKDNSGRKRYSDDNDEYCDLKSWNAKEHHLMVEKKSTSSSKKDSPADRGRSQPRHADFDSTVSRSRRRSPSPNTHFVKDQFRNSSKAEAKYMDSDERVRPNATPSRERVGGHGVSERVSESRSLEKLRSTTKPSKEEENLSADISVDRSPILASPAHLIEKSHSSTSIERRYSNRKNVKRSLDVEETGWRNSGFKDAKDWTANDDKGIKELPSEKPAADEFGQADGDTVSVSSSFNRNNHFSSNSSSIIPPAPSFRAGSSNPSVLGSSEEDSRGKSNRYRRTGDFNVGRGPGNAWKGLNNWPSPLPNSFLPFQHGPPPGGFHPMMQQFPAPPIFANHNGIPYHMPDADRFSVHMHGWDGGSNGVFGDESHIYGRQDWDQNRHMLNGRGWEVNPDMWKGQNSPAVPEKDDHLLSATANDVWAEHPSQRSRNERNRPSFRAESIEVKRSDETPPPAKDPIEAPPVKHTQEKIPEPSKTSNDNDAHFCHFYLSKLDISIDLTHPELYKKCMGLFDMEGNSTNDDDYIKHAQFEEPKEARVKISNTTSTASLFPILKDSVLQRAMLLYKKRDEETKANLPFSSIPGLEPESAPSDNCDKPKLCPTLGGEKPKTLSATDGETLEETSPSAQVMAKEPVPAAMMAEKTAPAEMMVEGLVPAEMMGEEPAPAQTMIEEPSPVQMVVEEPGPAQMVVEEPGPAQMVVEEPGPAQMVVEEPGPAQMVVEEPGPAQMVVKEPVPSQNLVEEPAAAQMVVEEPVPASDREKGEEPVLNHYHEKVPAPISDQGEAAMPILHSDQEKAVDAFPNSDHEKDLEPILNTDQEKAEDPVPIFYQERGEQPVLNSDQEKAADFFPISDKEKEDEQVLNTDQEKAEDLVSFSDQKIEESIANSPAIISSILVPGKEIIPEEVVLVSTSDHQEKVEAAINVFDREITEEAVEYQPPFPNDAHPNTTTYVPPPPTNEEAIVISSDSENENSSKTDEHKAANGTTCDLLGFTTNSSEVCEALTPESIECRSVNLSRIHKSSESTH